MSQMPSKFKSYTHLTTHGSGAFLALGLPGPARGLAIGPARELI
jgi:hypothetical protein